MLDQCNFHPREEKKMLKIPLEGGDDFFCKKNAISPFFDASGNGNIGATIRIGLEIWCLPYAGFFLFYFLYLLLKTPHTSFLIEETEQKHKKDHL